jgi:hypothetical protein
VGALQEFKAMTDVKRMDLNEFVETGYLQELNRRFLHPLGLALEVVVDEDGRVTGFGGVWDSRQDPGGIIYADGMLSWSKMDRIIEIEKRRRLDRLDTLGFWIQSVAD